MSYTVSKIITVIRDRLHESTDLTKSLASFAQTESYLVVVENKASYCLALRRIISFVKGLDLTKSVASVFEGMLSDEFVARYKSNRIPLALPSGLYTRRLNAFNPDALTNHSVHFTSVSTPQILDDASKKGFLDDLVILSKEDMTHYLVAVNGVFHRTTYFDKKLYVLDGFRTIRLSGYKDIQVIDTKDIGGHTIIPLIPNNVTKGAYQQDCVVTLNQSVQGKTVFAVIDGYFYHRDQQILSVASPTKVKLHTNKLLLSEQFKHNPKTIRRLDRYGPDVGQSSRKYTDDYERVFLHKTSIPTALLANADFQYSRLTTFHSFLVVINNPDLYTVTLDALPTGTPQFYYEPSNRTIFGMPSYGCGLSPSYAVWKDPFDRKYIFLPSQDDHVDHQNESISPVTIPTLVRDSKAVQNIPLKFIDYVSA